MFTVFKKVKTFNLKKKQKWINEYWINRDYYNSDINILTINKEELMKIADSEDSEKFIEKSDTEEPFDY